MQNQSKREVKRTGTVHGLCREGAPIGTDFLVVGDTSKETPTLSKLP